eukprot:Opistho-2@37475
MPLCCGCDWRFCLDSLSESHDGGWISASLSLLASGAVVDATNEDDAVARACIACLSVFLSNERADHQSCVGAPSSQQQPPARASSASGASSTVSTTGHSATHLQKDRLMQQWQSIVEGLHPQLRRRCAPYFPPVAAVRTAYSVTAVSHAGELGDERLVSNGRVVTPAEAHLLPHPPCVNVRPWECMDHIESRTKGAVLPPLTLQMFGSVRVPKGSLRFAETARLASSIGHVHPPAARILTTTVQIGGGGGGGGSNDGADTPTLLGSRSRNSFQSPSSVSQGGLYGMGAALSPAPPALSPPAVASPAGIMAQAQQQHMRAQFVANNNNGNSNNGNTNATLGASAVPTPPVIPGVQGYSTLPDHVIQIIAKSKGSSFYAGQQGGVGSNAGSNVGSNAGSNPGSNKAQFTSEAAAVGGGKRSADEPSEGPPGKSRKLG